MQILVSASLQPQIRVLPKRRRKELHLFLHGDKVSLLYFKLFPDPYLLDTQDMMQMVQRNRIWDLLGKSRNSYNMVKHLLTQLSIKYEECSELDVDTEAKSVKESGSIQSYQVLLRQNMIVIMLGTFYLT